MNCYNDWAEKFSDRAIDHFGRLTEPKKLIEENDASMMGEDTFLLVKNGQCYERTDAALEITKDLTGFWYVFRVLKILPKPFRDFFYRLFARNRYALFGRRDSCMLPTENIRERFLE